MMIRNIPRSLSYAVAVALLASVAVVGCKKKEEPVAVAPPPPVETAPATAPEPMPPAVPAGVSITSVTLGTSAGADKKIAAPTMAFTPKDKIIVSVATDGTASNAEVGAKLLYQDGQTAGDMKQALNTTGAETTNFEFTNAKPWPAGKYKAEVTINGASASTTEFEVK